MADRASVATAYVTVMPEISGAQSNITAGLQSTLGAAGEKAGTSLGTSLLTKLKGYSKQIVAAVGLSTLSKLAKDSVSSFTELASETKSLQRTMGGTAEEVSALSGAMKLSGVDTSKATTSLNKFAKSMSSAASGSSTYANAFSSLGVSVTDANGNLRSTSDVITDVSQAFSGMDDGAQKTALAMTLFGKSGTALLPFLNKGAAGIEELKAKAKELGIVIDDDGISKWAAYKSAVREWNTAIEGAKVQIGGALVPFVTMGATAMNTLLVPAITAASGAFSSFLNGLTSGIDLTALQSTLGSIADAFFSAFSSGGVESFGASFANMVNAVVPLLNSVTPLFSLLGNTIAFIGQHPEAATIIAGIAMALKGWNVISSIGGAIGSVVSGFKGIVSGAASTIASFTGIAASEAAAGAASGVSATMILASAAACVALGAAVVLAAEGMGKLADAAVNIATNGPGAAVVLAGMVATVAGLAAGAVVLGPALTASAVGILAFGAACLAVGAGIMLASNGIAAVADKLPIINEYGGSSIGILAGMAASCLALSAGFVALAASGAAATLGLGAYAMGMTAASAATTVGALALAAFSLAANALAAAVNTIGQGVTAMGDGFAKMGTGAQQLADNGTSAAWSLGEMGTAAWGASGNVSTMADNVTRLASTLGTCTPVLDALRTSAQSAAEGAKQAVVGACESMRQAVSSLDLKVSINVDKLPHFYMTGSFNAQTGEVPQVGVNWYATGAVFSESTLIGVGDNRKYSEAVLPLSPSVLGGIGEGIEREMGSDYNGTLDDIRALLAGILDKDTAVYMDTAKVSRALAANSRTAARGAGAAWA